MKTDSMVPISVIGGGLAGCEAVMQISRAGLECTLYEMKPKRYSPAHKSQDLAELVCSNSFKSESLERGPGVLKRELSLLGSVIMQVAEKTRVPAGSALAVDREGFAKEVTRIVLSQPGVKLVREEVTELPEQGLVITASGPLTSDALAQAMQSIIGDTYLNFYDAIAPIIELDSIDMSVAFLASRYDKGGADYINCPMDQDEYYGFLDALLDAGQVPLKDFEDTPFFEGCLPIEIMASRGRETLAYGPLKPVGLTDPRTGQRPYAVIQLRQDDFSASLYNMVGFQTKLTYPEQERVFRMIPGLKNAVFARLGSIHRNTFIRSPGLLSPDLSFRAEPRVFLAGQITGVEGYLESSAMGLMAGFNASRRALGLDAVMPPAESMTGGLMRYVTEEREGDFQPMNANFGLLPIIPGRRKRRERRRMLGERAVEAMQDFTDSVERA